MSLNINKHLALCHNRGPLDPLLLMGWILRFHRQVGISLNAVLDINVKRDLVRNEKLINGNESS